MTIFNVGGVQGVSSDKHNTSLFFSFAMKCDSTENSIEECGGVKESVTCDDIGTLKCLPGIMTEKYNTCMLK